MSTNIIFKVKSLFRVQYFLRSRKAERIVLNHTLKRKSRNLNTISELSMPSIIDAYRRHAKHYLDVADKANALFANEITQGKGVTIFDKSRSQIDLALNRILQQNPSEERDIQLVQYVDALSSIGAIRYSVFEDLIPWHEQVI